MESQALETTTREVRDNTTVNLNNALDLRNQLSTLLAEENNRLHLRSIISFFQQDRKRQD